MGVLNLKRYRLNYSIFNLEILVIINQIPTSELLHTFSGTKLPLRLSDNLSGY